ncbi:RNA polymerase sigma factor [Geodermatophilus maliterrae]|uniref:RNA polymerase sigma factor n=1 Tax=Geodermatophilus maliterrae TaxID=3162531 RepID=A0ABV3XFC0_9ACTN
MPAPGCPPAGALGQWPGARGGGLTAAGAGDRSDDEVPDAALAARARAGDERAFEVLVRRYQAPLYRLAVRLLDDRQEAEDVVQDVFVTAWRRLPALRDDAAVGGWLYRATTNRCLNRLRDRRTVPDAELERLPDPRPGEQPERVVEAAAGVHALAAALRRLTPEQRAVWVLRELHERSYDEIAGTLGTTSAAVRGRLARARADLAEAMAPWR